MSRSRVAPMVAGLTTAALAFAGLVATADEAQAASYVYVYVRTTGTDAAGCGVTQAQACASLGWARGEALSRTGDVVIDVGPGTFTPTDQTEEFFLAGPSGVSSLTVRGAGVGTTVLRPPQGINPFARGTSISVLSTVTYSVTIAHLTVEGDGQSDGMAIWDLARHTLKLSNIRITGLTGSSGGPLGGNPIGVLDLGGDLEITDTLIDNLQGGKGGDATGNNKGGQGGNAYGVMLQNARLTMDSTTITGIRGGDGGAGGSQGGEGGNGNVGVGIGGGAGGIRISDSTVTGITGGAAGSGGGGLAAEGYGLWLEGNPDDPATLTHLTIVGNDRGAQLTDAVLRASLFSNTVNCTPDVGYVDGGFNATTDAASGGCFTEPTDLLGFDPAALGTLGDNGGPTPTVSLDAGSPAAGSVQPAALCLGTDQRGPGFHRPATNCAAGAFQPNALASAPGSGAGSRAPGRQETPTAPAEDDGQPCGALTSRAKC